MSVRERIYFEIKLRTKSVLIKNGKTTLMGVLRSTEWTKEIRNSTQWEVTLRTHLIPYIAGTVHTAVVHRTNRRDTKHSAQHMHAHESMLLFSCFIARFPLARRRHHLSISSILFSELCQLLCSFVYLYFFRQLHRFLSLSPPLFSECSI